MDDPGPVRSLAVVAGVPVAGVVLLAIQARLGAGGERLDDPAWTADGLVVGAERAGPELVVLFLGDSTAVGIGASGPEASMPGGVATRIAGVLDHPVRIVSEAVSGARVSDVLADQLPAWRVRAAAGAPIPNLVVVSVGANDVTHLRTAPGLVRVYRRVLIELGRIADPGPAIALVGVPHMASIPRVGQPLRWIVGWRARALHRRLVRWAATESLGVADVAAHTTRVFADDPGASFAADHYHPGDTGYAAWAEAIAPVAIEALGTSAAQVAGAAAR